jgi:alcohol dehydrogenase
MFNLDEYINRLPEKLNKRIEYQMVGTKSKGKFIFGCGVIKDLGKEVKNFNINKVLLVSDETIKKIGIVDTINKILKEKKIEVDLFTDIESEPHSTTANKLADIVNSVKYDAIVGLGGGSVMDMAKISSIMATNSGTVEEYLKGANIEKDGLPKILIPTTAGTGSEVSPFVVCSIGEQKYYASTPQFIADVALIDPLLTITMPPEVTAYTGLDALSHAVEGMTSKKSSPISEAFGSKSIKLILSNLENAYKNGEDLEARYYMSWGSSLGMLAYANVGGLYAHSFSYVMTSHKGWAHGLGCGFSLPYTLMYNLNYVDDLLADIAISLGIASTSDKTIVAAEKIIEVMQELGEKVGVSKKLSDFDVKKEEIETFAEELINNYYRDNNPRIMDLNDAKILLNNMWKGKLK